VLDLPEHRLPHVVERAHLGVSPRTRRHGHEPVVLHPRPVPLRLLRLEHAHQPRLDEHPGVRRVVHQDQNVERVAVLA